MTSIQNLIFTMQIIHFGIQGQDISIITTILKNLLLNIHNKKECPKCKISKLRKKPYSASDYFTTEPLELVHTDVVGKLETSFQGYNYYLTFLDDFSRKCWVYLLKK